MNVKKIGKWENKFGEENQWSNYVLTRNDVGFDHWLQSSKGFQKVFWSGSKWVVLVWGNRKAKHGKRINIVAFSFSIKI